MTPQQAIQFRETTVRTPRFRLNERAGGILLHPTSLPGPHGSGDLGPPAQRFVDFHSVPNFQAVWTRELRKRLKWDELPVLEWPLLN